MDRFVRKNELPEICGYSPAYAMRLAKAGKFPKPIRLSSRRTVWRLSDIQAWITASGQPLATD